jgi:hypothetical protein
MTTWLMLIEAVAIGLVIMVAFGGLGARVASQRGRWEGEGFILGFLLGPLGVAIVAFLLPEQDPAGPIRPGDLPEPMLRILPGGFIPLERVPERRGRRRGR